MSALEPVPVQVPQSVEREGHALLQAALMHFEDQAVALHEQGDFEGLAWGRERLRDIIANARVLLDSIDGLALDLMDTKWVEVEGLGTVERKRATRRTEWQHQEAARAVLRDAWEHDEIQNPEDAVGVLLDAASIGSWKVTTLRRRGLDPTEFCKEEIGRESIVIHGTGADL